MKKYLLIAVTSIFCFNALAQYPGQTLFGTAPNADRTYRSLQLGITSITDTLGSTPDTLTIYPGEVAGNTVFHKIYQLTLKDSCVLAIRSTNRSFTGSTMTFIISNGAVSGSWVQFLGYSGLATQWKMTGGTTKISPTASHFYTLSFICTGTAWIETNSSQD